MNLTTPNCDSPALQVSSNGRLVFDFPWQDGVGDPGPLFFFDFEIYSRRFRS